MLVNFVRNGWNLALNLCNTKKTLSAIPIAAQILNKGCLEPYLINIINIIIMFSFTLLKKEPFKIEKYFFWFLQRLFMHLHESTSLNFVSFLYLAAMLQSSQKYSRFRRQASKHHDSNSEHPSVPALNQGPVH